ncbi:MAG TPA: hypothetical protein VNO21_06560 [Polyangiaceae bacterium]|nr:hypothetical protein [Polyangiaceae bacterium]
MSAKDTPHVWTFLHGPLVEGSRFSTAPEEEEFRMWSWSDRVDGGILDGHLFFLGFKHIEPFHGRQMFGQSLHWFDGKGGEPAPPP